MADFISGKHELFILQFNEDPEKNTMTRSRVSVWIALSDLGGMFAIL
jgi:hypothetical protein